MIIPVRCFTCGKVRYNIYIIMYYFIVIITLLFDLFFFFVMLLIIQIVGNKYETYVNLLNADMPEKYENN